MRLIDADALIEEMSEKHRPNFHEDLKAYHMWIMWYWAIKEAPTVEIVRCKDCKWLRYCETKDLDFYLNCDQPDGGGIPRSEEWFCADGERMTANADQHVQRVEYVENDERSRCWTCKHFERMHETPISSDGSYYTYVVCTAKECHYEPKDEPQTERSE